MDPAHGVNADVTCILCSLWGRAEAKLSSCCQGVHLGQGEWRGDAPRAGGYEVGSWLVVLNKDAGSQARTHQLSLSPGFCRDIVGLLVGSKETQQLTMEK